MIEKSFDKTYKMRGCKGIPQGALTRAANRLISDYTEVFGGFCIPDEIKTIAEKIKQGIDAKEYEFESENEYGGTGDKIYDTVKYTNETRACAFWDTDEYGDPVYCVTWYFFASEYYTKRLGKQTLRAASYTEILKKATVAKGKYRYFCTHRPPSGGCIPEGYVSFDTYSQDSRYIGEVTYNEQPPRDELIRWGLVIDRDWAQIRAAYSEADNER